MLALDSSLTHIDADTSDITHVYKSVAPLTVSLAGIPSEVCEAYVCVIKKNDLIRVYAGLATGGNRVFIYSPEKQPGTTAALAGTLKDALSFVEAMGFSMEELNLNYSPAMRDVVMRDIKVLRPPRAVPKPAAKKAPPPVARKHKIPEAPPVLEKIAMRESSAQQDLGQETAESSSAPPAVDTEELANLRGELVRLTTERAVAEQAAGARLAATREELEEIRAERDGLAETLAGQEAAAARLAADIKGLKAEMAAMQTKQEAALRELHDRLAERDAELARLQGENEALGKARDAVADALRKEQGMRIAAQEDARQTEARLSEELSQARRVRNELDAGHGEALERVTAELGAARTELERVTAEKISAQELAEQQTELARLAAAELASLNGELARVATEKIAAEQLAATQAELARTTAAELAAVRAGLPMGPAEEAVAEERGTQQETPAETAATALAERRGEPVVASTERVDAEETPGGPAEPEQPAVPEPAMVGEELPEPATMAEVPEVAVAGEAEPTAGEVTAAENGETAQEVQEARLKEELASLKTTQAASEKMLRELAALQQRTLEELAAAKQALTQAPQEAPSQLPAARTDEAAADTVTEPDRSGLSLPRGGQGPRPHEPEPENRFAALMPTSPPPQSSGGSQLSGLGDVFGRDLSASPAAPTFRQPGASAKEIPADFPPDDEPSFFGTDARSPGFFPDDAEDFRFTLQPGMEEIGYGAGTDLIALYQSINVVRLAQGGETAQGSKGFVCALRCGESFRVYAAIFLLERERTFVYAPQIQPQGEDTLAAAVRSGLDFAEMTGYMMDEANLDVEPARLARLLAKVPVLKQQNAN